MDDQYQNNSERFGDTRQGRLSRREMIQRLTALGLTVPAAASLVAARARRAGAQDRIRVSFANVLETGELFVQLGNGVQHAAEVAGYEFKRYNNEFDAEKTLANARLMVQDEPDVILEYNGVEGIGPAIKRLFDDAGVPFVAINVPIPGGHWFNLVNQEIGTDTANVVVPLAKAKGWSGADTTVIIIQASAAGVEVNDCVRYFYVTAAQTMDGMTQIAPDEITATTTTIGDTGIQVDGGGVLEQSYTAVKNALQTLSADRKVLLYSVNDDSTLGAWRAITEANRQDNTIVAGLGGSVAALGELRTNPHWVAEGSVFATHWGQYLIAMVAAILDGVTLPPLTKCPQIVLTRDTVDKYYDAEGKVQLLPPLDDTNSYLAATGILQKFNNIEGLS